MTLLGLLGWAISLALAGAGQVIVVSGEPLERARPLHVLALVAALVSGRFLPSPAETQSRSAPISQSGGIGRLGAGAILVSVVLVATSVWVTAEHLYALAPVFWLLGLGVLVVGCSPPLRAGARRWRNRHTRESAGLVGIMLGAFVMRLVDLASLPPQVHGDEAAIGNEARKQLIGQVQDMFGLGWYDIPNLSFAISAAFMRVFGNDLFGLRMASVVQGTLSVVVTFLLVRRLFGPRVAVLAASLLAVTEIHVHYSRIGVIYMQAGLVTVLVLYLFLRAIDQRRPVDYVLLGISGGLSLVVYAAARLALLLVVACILHAIVRDRSFLRTHASGLALAAAAGLLFFAPMGVVYSAHPETFNVRTGDISVLAGPGLRHELSAYGVSTRRDVLRIQAQKTVEGFVYTGETSDQYGHSGEPLLDPFTAALFVAGVGAFALRFRNPAYFLLSTWLWLTLILGSVLTVDAPFSPHLVGMLPLLAIYPSLFFNAGGLAAERLVRPRPASILFGLLSAALIGAVSLANFRDYLEVHVVRLQPAGFPTVLGRYIRDINGQYTVYLISRPDTFLRYDTTLFLAPDMDGVDLHDRPLTPPPPAPGKGMAFIVEAAMSDAAARLAELRQRYPSGHEAAHHSARGDVLFYSYLVDSA